MFALFHGVVGAHLGVLKFEAVALNWIRGAFVILALGLVLSMFVTKRFAQAVGTMLVAMVIGIFVFSPIMLQRGAAELCQQLGADLGGQEADCAQTNVSGGGGGGGGGGWAPVTVPRDR